jgi:hypothetical protein
VSRCGGWNAQFRLDGPKFESRVRYLDVDLEDARTHGEQAAVPITCVIGTLAPLTVG